MLLWLLVLLIVGGEIYVGPLQGGIAAAPYGAAPTAPRRLSAGPGDGTAMLHWQSPASNGGAPITGYIVTHYVAGKPSRPHTYNTIRTTQVIARLTNARHYTFTVAAKNRLGVGPASASSNTVIVGSPAAPTGVHPVRVAPGRFKVNFSPGRNNGAKATSYAATCTSTNGGVAKTKNAKVSPITVTGLSRGKKYKCTVRTTNSRGTGPPSLASGIVRSSV